MARGLEDVLHHFDPALGAGAGAQRAAAADPTAPAVPAPAPEPRDPAPEADAPPPAAVGVPVEAGDLLRTAIVWNLGVEIARRGVRTRVLTPGGLAGGGLPCDPPVSGFAALPLPAADPARLVRQVCAAPLEGLSLLALPAETAPGVFAAGLSRALLLTGPDEAALLRSEALGALLVRAAPAAELGVTVHGARCVGEAREAFESLASRLGASLDCEVVSYGMLVDDLALYRSVVERRPVGLARPQSAAARALADVARLLAGGPGAP